MIPRPLQTGSRLTSRKALKDLKQRAPEMRLVLSHIMAAYLFLLVWVLDFLILFRHLGKSVVSLITGPQQQAQPKAGSNLATQRVIRGSSARL